MTRALQSAALWTRACIFVALHALQVACVISAGYMLVCRVTHADLGCAVVSCMYDKALVLS